MFSEAAMMSLEVRTTSKLKKNVQKMSKIVISIYLGHGTLKKQKFLQICAKPPKNSCVFVDGIGIRRMPVSTSERLGRISVLRSSGAKPPWTLRLTFCLDAQMWRLIQSTEVSNQIL
jgi:hypothetical protein